LGIWLGVSAASCGTSSPTPGVVVLRDASDGGAGADAVRTDGSDGPVDVPVEARACETDEQCKGAFPAPPDCRAERCEGGACVLAVAGEGTPCAVGDACRRDAVCSGGECLATPVDCDDGNDCTEDGCTRDLGCFYRALEGPCDDRKPWTTGDRCEGGRCVGETGPCTCESDRDCLAGDDGDACNGVPRCRDCVCVPGAPVVCDTSADGDCARTTCDPLTGACRRAPAGEGQACDDGSRCSVDDRCTEGWCRGVARDCDDDNPCTNDACDAQAGCLHFANLADCDDGNACTRNDACVEGYCVGTTRACDDGDPCTADSCEPASGCQHAPVSDVACDDSFSCTEVDVCVAGVCVGTANTCACETAADCVGQVPADLCRGTLSCTDSVCAYDPGTAVVCPVAPPGSCTVQRCVPQTGRCQPFAVDDGTPCDDGTACTSGDTCRAGACVAVPVSCDDGNPCTDDACEPDVGCTHVPNHRPCDDGNPCTVQTVCSRAACGGGSPRSCDDGEACTRDWCDPAAGCQHAPTVGTCDDGNACTEGDHCRDGACAPGTPVVCRDERPCTLDRCDPLKGCEYVPNDGAACDDRDPCTTSSVCVGVDCVGTGRLDCDDDEACTDDVCTPGVGCVHVPGTGGPCDDGNPCTQGDACLRGGCVSGENVCDCATTADCAPLEDGNPCNGTLVCDTTSAPFRCVVDPATIVVCDDAHDSDCRRNRCQPATGACALVAVRDGQGCDDGDACTTGDTCQAGECRAGSALVCQDGEACTDDTCDPARGCVHTPNEADCDDGNACTTGDRCSGGVCRPGGPLDCDDDDVCTLDTCAPGSGCGHVPSSAPCDDGDACTLGDTCVDGTCTGPLPLGCDDGEVCTADGCDPRVGCTHDPIVGPCDDGDPCTVGDHCVGGVCVPTTVTDCDDGDPCTADVCGASGCEWPRLPFGTACDDGDAATTGDLCASTGDCIGWRQAEVARPGARSTRLTDVAWTRFSTLLGTVERVHVTGHDTLNAGAWTWVGALAGTTLDVGADQFQGDVLTDVSYRLALGERLTLRFDGARWWPETPLAGLGHVGDVRLRAVHGYWTERDLVGVTVTAETFYLAGLSATDGGPRLWRCRWSSALVVFSGWECQAASVPAGGVIEHVWGTRKVQGGGYTDDRAWAAQVPTSVEVDPGARVLLSAAGGADTWSAAPPAGCSAAAGTPCEGARWHDLAGPVDHVWAVGARGRLLRNTGSGWAPVSVPAAALWPDTALVEYTFRAVRVSATRGVQLAGEWSGCSTGPCPAAREPDVRRLFWLRYDPRSDRWDTVRTLLEARCPGPVQPTVGCAAWLSRYEVAAMEVVEGAAPQLYVVGSRPLATADGTEDSAGLVFHLVAE
jgi:hypothetical protein